MNAMERRRTFSDPVTGSLVLHLLCVLAVMAAAVLVRTPPLAMHGETKEAKEAFTDESGLPYLTDLDSYYHVRLVDNYMKNGTLGDSVLEDGTAWDFLRNYPEGASAAYQPGIVWLTSLCTRLTGAGTDAVEYRISAFMSALSALAAYMLGCGIGKRAGGFSAGLFTACAPLYVSRTCYGRFDTDMFVVLMELLLILCVTQIDRAKSRAGGLCAAAAFALTAAVYSLCWTPTYSTLFTGLTFLGGSLFWLTRLFSGKDRPLTARFVHEPALWSLPAAGVLTAAALLVTAGPSLFSSVLHALFFTTSSGQGKGSLPNLLGSISELTRSPLLPRSPLKAFSGYIPGETPSMVNGIGGLAVFVLALACLAWLILAGCTRPGRKEDILSRRECLLYACVLAPWLAAGLFLPRTGVRFIEHLSIPTGLLAGGAIGRLFAWARRGERKIRFLLPAAVFAAAAIPLLSGAVRFAADVRPSVTDASVHAMQFIRENAKEDDAVIASWWDMGYFYENASRHPCLWDGGTDGGPQSGIRTILVSKALTANSMDLARRILLMLSCSGNTVPALLMEHTDTATAFDALFKALVSREEEALTLLEDRCGLSAAQAKEAWQLMRPAAPKETYLVLTYTMTRQIGWYEYYAGWDFTGTQEPPAVTRYNYTPDGTPLFTDREGETYKDTVRSKEMMWRLFFEAETTPCFRPVYEWHDGLEHVRVWKVCEE